MRRCSTRFRDPSFWLSTRGTRGDACARTAELERAIGVIYRPDTERQSHYFEAFTGAANSTRSSTGT